MERHGTTAANPLGVHALVWTGSWDQPAVAAACRKSRASGFDILEVPLLDPDSVDAEMTRQELEAAGLAPTCSLGLSFDTDISSAAVDTVERGRRLLLKALEVTSGMGSAYLGGVIYSALDKYRTPPTEEGRANCVAVLRDLAAAAEEMGITLGLEPVNRYESNLINTVDQALDLIDMIGSENIVVHLDAYHGNIEEADLVSPVHRANDAGKLGYIHVGESHRGALGTGQVDLPGLIGALVEVRYRGPIVFESFSSAIVSETFVGALAIWRDLWTDNVQLAEDANRYLRETIAAAQGTH